VNEGVFEIVVQFYDVVRQYVLKHVRLQ